MTTQASAKTARNQTMECCKLLAAVLVVFLHTPFPGAAGKTVNCLARVAVPLFFAISGWFSFQAGPDRLRRRFFRTLLLEAAGIGISVLWRCCLTVYYGGSLWEQLCGLIPGREAVMQWVLWNVDPFAGHLWYLSAAAACYGVLWLYTLVFRGAQTNYRPLYVISGILLAAHFAMANFSRFTGVTAAFAVWRNAWFFGLPMFSMGIFLRQYRERILEKAGNKLGWILAFGVGLSLLERRVLGAYDLPVGMTAAVAALLLLASAHPQIPERYGRARKAASRFGALSTAVYMIHLVVLEAYQTFAAWRLEAVLGSAEAWLRPVAVAALSIAAGILWSGIRKAVKHK